MRPITHRPKVGDILECDFGQWADPVSYNGHIKPEMRKRRLVVILNGHLDGNGCFVVPISSSEADERGFSKRFHVPLPTELFPVTDQYDKRERWALADRLTMVSKERLFNILDKSARLTVKLPPELVTQIQTFAIMAINAKSLLKNE